MNEKEGVTKYRLDFEPASALPADQTTELNAWRKIVVMLKMIGQSPDRYHGLGYGNISRRLSPTDNAFLISGTQTGGQTDLGPSHYTTVLRCDAAQNHVVATGPIRPSSEAMTHSVLYQLSAEINWVFHGHDPIIWHKASALNLPTTDAGVAYGTPAMSNEVVRLFAETDVATRKFFVMGGHEDGIIAFGKSAEEAGSVLLNTLAAALALT